MGKNVFIIILFLFPIYLNAQPFDLLIYIKDDCGRCVSTKNYLDSNKMVYEECYLFESYCTEQMWKKLECVTSEKNILPPVILINEIVVYPVFENGRLMPVPKSEFLDRLYSLYYTALPLPYSYSGQDVSALKNISQNSQKLNKLESKIIDVKTRKNRFYIIAGSFLEIKTAISLKKSLISKGYENTKILKYRNYYRVSINDFAQKQDAQDYTDLLRNSISTWIVRY